MNYYDEFMKLSRTCTESELISFVLAHGERIVKDALSSKTVREADLKEYKYMITFTLDPKKVDLKSAEDVQKVEDYIVKLLKCSANFRFYYAKEHADSNPHWHVVIHRYKPFPQSEVSYYKKKYGMVDISRSKILIDEASMKYLGKESNIVTIK